MMTELLRHLVLSTRLCKKVWCSGQVIRVTLASHPTNITMADTWVLRIRAMIADGRLTFDKEINGKKVYILDRKRLGMS